MNKIKPCRFCGGEAEMKYPQFAGKHYYVLGCSNCGVWTDEWNTEENAVEIWNILSNRKEEEIESPDKQNTENQRD